MPPELCHLAFAPWSLRSKSCPTAAGILSCSQPPPAHSPNMHTPINSRTTPPHNFTTTPACTTDTHPAFPSQQVFVAADTNAAADQASHAGGQLGSHRKGFNSPPLVAMLPQEPLPGCSAVPFRQQEKVTDAEMEGTASLCDSGDAAQQHKVTVSSSWGKREGSAAKVLSHKGTESAGLDIDAFLPPSLSPRQARNTALP